MLNKRRMEFTTKVKEVIAQRAGYRCCFPGCGRLLVGPDSDPHKSVNIGECAHIYAAAEDGPRGRGSLTDAELTSSENGLFLCHAHHKMIDRPGSHTKYPSSLLLYYKVMHEHEILVKWAC